MVSGKAWKFGDDINTDVIFAGRYTYRLMSDEEMGKYAMEDADSDFNQKAAAGDVIVAGKNFGCGSSREQAVKCLKTRGVAAVVTKGFARIFYRNALNEGLFIIVCPEAVDAVEEGETVEIWPEENKIVTLRGSFSYQPYPKYVQGLVAAGGLIPFTQKRLRKTQ